MLPTEQSRADIEALNELIVNCPDLDKLNRLIGGFNIFQVLKFEWGEIRHSNVLAWLFDPQESHGLGDSFLKMWLKRVVHENRDEVELPITPVDVECWEFRDVEVRREVEHIDLLLHLRLVDDGCQIVCIENKVKSKQHSNQLRRYYETAKEASEPDREPVCILLSKDGEEPEDERFIVATYDQVHRALSDSLESRKNAVGDEPRTLMQNYLRLLEEKFMEESDIAKTARKIYQQHKRAMDIIFEHMPDRVGSLTDTVYALLDENKEKLGIVLVSKSKGTIRLIPKSWNCPGNSHGTAWQPVKQTVLFELSMRSKTPSLKVVSGKAPDKWADEMWDKSAKAPFSRQKRHQRPRDWCSLHRTSKRGPSIADDANEAEDVSDLADKIFDWVAESLKDTKTQQVIEVIANSMDDLEKAFQQEAAP